MARARVTATQVKELISTSLTDAVVTSSMIDTAHLMVDNLLSEAGYTESLLGKIELYLAAHYLCLTEEEGAHILSKTGDATEEWNTDWFGPGFNSTRFGQAALAMDSSGILAAQTNTKLRAQFRVV